MVDALVVIFYQEGDLEMDLNKEIQKKQHRLYYITHKDDINKRRKNYKRQVWSERKDNPKNAINVVSI